MKNLLKLFSVIILCICTTVVVHAQDTKDTKKAARIAEVTNMLKSMNYIFVANSVSTQQGVTSPLNGSIYDLNISKDTVKAFLPYFGQMYSAPMDAGKGGIKLISTDFVYQAKVNKKGAWDISIKPKDQNSAGAGDVSLFRLSVYADGYASLYVRSTDREPISFDGYIEERNETGN
jgi:hypothetical protein